MSKKKQPFLSYAKNATCAPALAYNWMNEWKIEIPLSKKTYFPCVSNLFCELLLK